MVTAADAVQAKLEADICDGQKFNAVKKAGREVANTEPGFRKVNDERAAGIDLYIATGKQKHGEPEPPGVTEAVVEAPAETESAMDKMKQKLKTEAGKALYKMRKAIVEPVFGQIKAARGIRAFLLRGMEKASAEWKLICATHNLLKLFRASHAERKPQTA